jgi:hypothetical protein
LTTAGKDRPLRFATLGPEGSNHELVAKHYLSLHEQHDAQIALVSDFAVALELLVRDEVDHILQVAVHPTTTTLVAQAHFKHRIHVVDAFVAPSHPLAILTRVEVETPTTLALQPATKDYADTSPWPTLIPEISTATVAEGLLAGRYDSGITRLDLADRYPGRFRVETVIGTVDDPWIVYGKARTCEGPLLAWKDSPLGRRFARRPR